jgi:hypothetical protein
MIFRLARLTSHASLASLALLASSRLARAIGLVMLALGLSVVMYWPALASYPISQGGDGPMFHRMVEAGKVSLSRYHELPLWNAYECGGAPLWANPESIVSAPLILLMQPLNTTVTMRVWYVVHHAMGFLAMWLFSRHELRLSRGASLAASVIFSLTVAHGSQYAGGHAALVGFLYAPAALLLWRRAENDARFAVGLGLLFAWMFYEGAPYPVPHITLLLVAETFTRVWPPRRALAVVKSGAIFGGVFLSVSAARLLPVLGQLREHPRLIVNETDALSWQTVTDIYLAKVHEWRFSQVYVWGEYIGYVGILVVALCLVGILFTRREEAWYVAVAALFFALMLGHFAAYAPWHVLNTYVFPWKSMRVPVRFRLILLLFIAGWVGMAVDRLPPLVARWFGAKVGGRARVVMLGLALIGAGDALGYSSDVVRTKFDGPIAQPVAPSARLHFGGAQMAGFIDQPRQNRGRLECWGEWNFTAGAPQWQGDVPQARSSDPNVVVEVANRTQNTFTIDVDAKAPGRVLVNVPYDAGWRTNWGEVENENKLLVVDVPAGRGRIELKYWPAGLTLGFVLSALGLAASLAFLFRRRRLV